MPPSSSRPDFRNSTAQSLRKKSRSLNRFIRKHISYSDCNQQTTGSVPPRIQDLISLVKYWYEQFVRPGNGQYGHEAVVIATVKAWRKFNSPKTINMAIAFKAVMVELRDYAPYHGAMPSFKQAVMETLNKPLLIDVSVTRNWCRTPIVRSVQKTIPRATPIATIPKPSNVYEDDFRDLPPKDLDKFIAEQLQPNEKFHELVSTALDNLYHYLQGHMRSPTVRRLIKGGSIGKGTALKGRSDLDCILVMNGVRDAHELEKKIDGILDQLKGLLKEDPLRQDDWGITIIRVNGFLVQIEMRNFQRDKSVDVDILPTFDADVLNNRKQLYDQMKAYDNDTQQYCSAALAELKLEFIRPKPTKLKSLIRLVKYWCKTYLPSQGGQRMPNSYLLELLTIRVWENAGKLHSFQTASLFKDLMRKLCNHRQLNVAWSCYYEPNLIDVESIPRVVDPANPYNNVYDVVQGWRRVKRVAMETMNKQLLQDV